MPDLRKANHLERTTPTGRFAPKGVESSTSQNGLAKEYSVSIPLRDVSEDSEKLEQD